MELQPTASVSLDQLSTEQLIDAHWRAGDLRWKLEAHQKVAWDAQTIWEAQPLPGLEDSKPGAARWWVDDWGRRVGKTYKNGTKLVSNGIRRPNSRMIYATKTELQMKEILIPTIESICSDAPEDIRPKFFSSRWGMRAGYHFPGSDSVLKLVGLDKDPDGLRGTYLDWCAISEAAFIKGLSKIVTSIIGPQFMRRSHARGYMESSAPEQPEHDFDTFYVPDAKRRNAYWFYTFKDMNGELKAEAELEYRQAADQDKVGADREYLGIRSRDFDTVVIPEFNNDMHVREWDRPAHAVALAGLDPGYRHLFGVVWGYYEFETSTIVIEDSWAGSNAGTARVACIMAAREFELYGRPPPSALSVIPLDADGARLGWRDHLRGDRCEALAEELHRLVNLPLTERPDYEARPGRFIREDRPGQWTYWDSKTRQEYMPNPHARVADVDLRLIHDLGEQYGFEVSPTTKEHLRTMVANTRRWFSQGRIVFLPSAGPVIDHVRAGLWAKERTHFDEHRVHGHYDLLACLVYLTRYAELIENIDPAPPKSLLVGNLGQQVIERLPWNPRTAYEQEQQDRIDQAEAALQQAAYASGRLREAPRMRGWK